jgi:hypothetical protein
MDRILEEACTKFGPGKAKTVMQKKLLDVRDGQNGFEPRPASVRNRIERRMVQLGLPTGDLRKSPEARSIKPWASSETTALLAALGGDLLDESVEDRTHHTIKAARAKLARLGHKTSELRGLAFTVDEAAAILHVTSRQVRRWKENGWLKTTRRRVSDKDLAAFLKDHHDRVPYDFLPRQVQVFLISLGYPAKDAAAFRATVKSILEDIGGRKKRSDARAVDHSTHLPRVKPVLTFASSA